MDERADPHTLGIEALGEHAGRTAPEILRHQVALRVGPGQQAGAVGGEGHRGLGLGLVDRGGEGMAVRSLASAP